LTEHKLATSGVVTVRRNSLKSGNLIAVRRSIIFKSPEPGPIDGLEHNQSAAPVSTSEPFKLIYQIQALNIFESAS